MFTVANLAAISNGAPQTCIVEGPHEAAIAFCGGAPGQHVLVIEAGTNALAVVRMLDFAVMPLHAALQRYDQQSGRSNLANTSLDRLVTVVRYAYTEEL